MTNVKLTKQVVAQRQLLAAIQLRFNGADLVPVYSLAANAWEIIDVLATRAGVDSISNQTREHIPEGKSLKHNYVNSPYRNFFKHADTDPDASVPPLKDANVDSIIFLGVDDYLRLFEKAPVEFQVFQLWYLSMNKDKMTDDSSKRVIPTINVAFPNIDNLPMSDRIKMAREVLRAASVDPELLRDPRTEPHL